MTDDRRHNALTRFLLLFALAYAGGVVGYVPLLSLLLPLRVEEMAGETRIGLLTVITIVGGITASGANILFGALSDRSWRVRRSRRRWIGAGLATTGASYFGLWAAANPVQLIAAVVIYQIALNMMLAPLLATMADAVPDGRKGLAGGLLTPAQPAAALVGAAVTGWAASAAMQFAVVVGVVAALVLPLLVAGRPPVAPVKPEARGAGEAALRQLDLVFLWSSRLLVQIAVGVLFTYLLFFFAGVARDMPASALASQVGWLTAIAYLVSVPVALLAGWASDRWRARKPFLLAAAVLATVGIVGMAVSSDWATAAASYAVFAVAGATFLALQSAYAMQVLPSPDHRARDLGLINLANTVPALLGPAITWSLMEDARFERVLAVLAVLTIGGGLMVLPVRSGR